MATEDSTPGPPQPPPGETHWTAYAAAVAAGAPDAYAAARCIPVVRPDADTFRIWQAIHAALSACGVIVPPPWSRGSRPEPPADAVDMVQAAAQAAAAVAAASPPAYDTVHTLLSWRRISADEEARLWQAVRAALGAAGIGDPPGPLWGVWRVPHLPVSLPVRIAVTAGETDALILAEIDHVGGEAPGAGTLHWYGLTPQLKVASTVTGGVYIACQIHPAARPDVTGMDQGGGGHTAPAGGAGTSG